MAKAEGVGTASAKLDTGAATISAINAAMTAMDEAEVPTEGRILYITPTLKRLIDELDTYKSKKCLEGISKVVIVPQTRFYSDVTIDNNGFAKAADAKNLNFILLDPKAAFAVAKHKKLRVFDPNTNQKRDDYLFQYRLYHDMFVYPQKAAGIYVHKAI
jgi:hypothetical protein